MNIKRVGSLIGGFSWCPFYSHLLNLNPSDLILRYLTGHWMWLKKKRWGASVICRTDPMLLYGSGAPLGRFRGGKFAHFGWNDHEWVE